MNPMTSLCDVPVVRHAIPSQRIYILKQGGEPNNDAERAYRAELMRVNPPIVTQRCAIGFDGVDYLDLINPLHE